MNLQSKALEVVYVAGKKLSCEGAKSDSAHPLVYLNMGNEDHVICPYCSRYFTIIPNPVTIGIKNQIKD